ncbi:hypothetical protein C8Q70DRAFT_86448 [Cubamyces menziesii]|nr:hypothetical protein C8Q70DRAFT_86448 [Cubamyces menziesii]
MLPSLAILTAMCLNHAFPATQPTSFFSVNVNQRPSTLTLSARSQQLEGSLTAPYGVSTVTSIGILWIRTRPRRTAPLLSGVSHATAVQQIQQGSVSILSNRPFAESDMNA